MQNVVYDKSRGPSRPMTRFTGCPVAHNKSSLTAGPNGPVLLQDIHLLEKITHFTREKIPARNVHALGTGVYGKFTATNDISKYSKADLFKLNKTTDLFVRFSGIFTEQGDPETMRDGRGFAIKFYTEEGNWDLMGINTPVFPLRDMKIGPDLIHSFKRDPRHAMWNPTSLWDFVVNQPEGFHHVLMLYSDRGGTPMSYRGMTAWGCNTFSFLNSNNERFWCKFHILPMMKPKGLDQHQAKMVAGEDTNFLSRDLWDAIERGDFPKYKLCCQVMPEKDGYRLPFAFDPTKVWKHGDYPLIDIGIIELNRNPTDYFCEVEQVAFSSANVVPGIGFSPDKLLQGRLLVYDDAQHHRIGPNFKMLPINCPKAPVNSNYDIGGDMNYNIKNRMPHRSPSIFGGPMADEEKYRDLPFMCDGPADYYSYPNEGTWEDYYGQPANFWQILKETERRNLTENIATSFMHVEEPSLIPKVLEHLRKINQDLGAMVEKKYRGMKEGSIPPTESQKLVEQLRSSMKGISTSQ